MKIEHRGHTYEIVNSIPRGYEIWNIGSHAPEGYLPLCRLKANQPVKGSKEIEPDTLKIIKCNDTQLIFKASMYTPTITDMERYVKRYQNSTSNKVQRKVNCMKQAIDILKQLNWE